MISFFPLAGRISSDNSISPWAIWGLRSIIRPQLSQSLQQLRLFIGLLNLRRLGLRHIIASFTGLLYSHCPSTECLIHCDSRDCLSLRSTRSLQSTEGNGSREITPCQLSVFYARNRVSNVSDKSSGIVIYFSARYTAVSGTKDRFLLLLHR
jgi:hypothetical protein